MNNKRPYNDLLKNLFHEQATEIIPLLLPDYHVEEILDIEMPDLKSTPIANPPTPLDEGIVGLILPEAKVIGVYKTEWIEHSGEFERTYRCTNAKSDKPTFLVFEFQTERKDEELSHRLLANFASINRFVYEEIDLDDDEDADDSIDDDEDADDSIDGEQDEVEQNDNEAEVKHEGTIMNEGYNVYPFVLCPFPQGVPARIRDEFMGQVTLAFNFMTIDLWEKDAREFLNKQASAVYFLFPVMKNADATLLGLAIAQLAQRFRDDEQELGRHLTGLNLLLQRSETMEDAEKFAVQEHLKPFTHLLNETLI